MAVPNVSYIHKFQCTVLFPQWLRDMDLIFVSFCSTSFYHPANNLLALWMQVNLDPYQHLQTLTKKVYKHVKRGPNILFHKKKGRRNIVNPSPTSLSSLFSTKYCIPAKILVRDIDICSTPPLFGTLFPPLLTIAELFLLGYN